MLLVVEDQEVGVQARMFPILAAPATPFRLSAWTQKHPSKPAKRRNKQSHEATAQDVLSSNMFRARARVVVAGRTEAV